MTTKKMCNSPDLGYFQRCRRINCGHVHISFARGDPFHYSTRAQCYLKIKPRRRLHQHSYLLYTHRNKCHAREKKNGNHPQCLEKYHSARMIRESRASREEMKILKCQLRSVSNRVPDSSSTRASNARSD